MQAHDVMTAEVVTVNADTPLPQIACVLLEHGISAVPGTGRRRRSDRHGQRL